MPPMDCSSRNRLRLALALAAVSLVWLVVLPALSAHPPIRARLDAHRAKGIDAGAMYYTELPLIDEVLAEMRRFRQAHPQALWQPTAIDPE